ncbi:zinc finger BED domain-containing protein 4-like [Rhizophagus irregularis DAOM 181602=DAOM 197198]|nr:zinc finger BED domain-containing protein 4-like [Rhizophagus irregularis DAOM 181602=DAOM 197198]
MSTERTLETHVQSEDNYIDIIDIENHTPVTSPLDNTNIEKYTKNAFDKLLNKEEHDLDFQAKNKGGSKLRNNGENCTSKIETSSPTGNIISHLNRKHKIYEHSKPSATITPSLKQVKIDRYTISSDSHPQMTPDRQKYLETLLFEWLILDFQPFYLLKSPSFRRFINALSENFELPSDKEFRKRIFEAYEFSKNKLKQYIHENAASVSLTCDLWTSRSKQGFLGVICHFITPDFEMREITLAIQYMSYPHTGEAIQHALEKIITQWELQNKLHRLSCTAHTIQLVVRKGLLTAEILIARAKRLINFFTSPKQNERLLNVQKKISDDVEEGSDLHGIFYRAITDVEKCWSSTYIAWERLIALKPYIDIVISSLNACKDNNAKEDALENYFEVIEKEALIAALLDPRKKKTAFANNEQKVLAKANLHEIYELAKNTNIQLEEYDESHDLQTEDNEVERYLVIAQIKNDQDPLKWWDVNKSQFPVLAQLA